MAGKPLAMCPNLPKKLSDHGEKDSWKMVAAELEEQQVHTDANSATEAHYGHIAS